MSRFLHLAVACLVLSTLQSLRAAEPPAPFGALPQARQLTWQRMEYYAFVHFGLNTWTDREWGYGDESEKLFNPDHFDARAIVHEFKLAGMKGMILTAKHHDGFCLWPTKTTPHNISKSPWQGGKGDLIKEFATACKEEGMKLGIYVSPWDRNNAGYAKEAYVKVFHEQIREVLSNYGPIFEIWFDGANGGDGYYGGAKEKRTIPEGYYRFPEAVEMIRKLQPNCVVWSAGDARWGGSEQGFVGYPQWHTMDSKRHGDIAHGVPHGDRWMPAEGDTSIRPGWFWHARENTMVKAPEKLLQVWFDCVGRGANLILNVPPDRSGRIGAPDIASLTGFRELRDSLLSTNFAAGATTEGTARGNDPKFSAGLMTDGDIESYWAADDGVTTPTAEIHLEEPATFNVVRLREQIRLGQRVDSFEIDAWTNGKWEKIHDGKTIGNQVLAKLSPAVTTDRLRLRITGAAAVPCISEFSLYRMPILLAAPNIARADDGKVVISSNGSGKIVFTTDGSEPNTNSTEYLQPIAVPDGGTINARVADGARLGTTTSQLLGVSKKRWKIVSATNGDAEKAIDEDPKTFWHTHPTSGEHKPPQSFDVDMGREIKVAAFTYLPRQDGTAHGMTDRYRFDLSRDGMRWLTFAEGEFPNILANPIEQVVPLKTPVSARYFRFTGLHAVEKDHVSAAEIGVISAP